ncbi:ADP-ribosylglycohydrolase family protein [Marinospirillum insulare]|uniref:ADP-ribosylglycohydrolase n=1 Tax=Marinospirillum insulare TaxID=217169 RepID=A0ABQ5ZWL6_9GAMM|nr:ADP-ribosylglycohydrolase family protein [Marinospirillum insulare]GLR64585.1 hypothetical protein GCM10007878_20230 [Marinospirillum insulare]
MRNNQDFALGSLLGLACGDALGTTVEFAPRDSFPLHTEITGGGIFKLAPGEWTDDTAMALCLATSLVDCQGFDSKDQLKNYLRWYQDGYLACQHICIDIGLATRKALKLFAETQTDYAGSLSWFGKIE